MRSNDFWAIYYSMAVPQSKFLDTRRPRRVSQLKFFERVWGNIPLSPPYKGGLRGMFPQFSSPHLPFPFSFQT